MNCLNNMKMYTSYIDEKYRHVFYNTIIKSWGYMYYDLSGRFLQLMSDKILLNDFFNNELFADLIIDNLTRTSTSFYSSDIANDTLLPYSVKRILTLQGYTYFFDIFHTHSDYTEIYTFATLENPLYANNYILNNLDILKTIGDDLSIRCKRLLTKENTLILPKDLTIQINEISGAPNQVELVSLKNNLCKFPGNNSTLFEKINDTVFDFNQLPFSFLACKDLTHREKEMIYLYYQGFSNYRIGEILDLSRRTIEKHFENIRKKLNCETSGQIIPTLLRYDMLIQASINKR